jgi:hypothetical protein
VLGLLAGLATFLDSGERAVDLRSIRFEVLGAIQVTLRLVAAAELKQRVAEVVVRVTLGEVARSCAA